MKKLLLLITLFMLCSVNLFSNEDASTKKVVFDLTSGDLEVFEKKVLSGIAYHKVYYESNLEELQIAIVIHGDAYKFFIKDLSISPYKNEQLLKKKHIALSKRLKSLVNIYEVEFLICRSGMNKLKINPENIYEFVTLVPTSSVALIDKQFEGYSYVPLFK